MGRFTERLGMQLGLRRCDHPGCGAVIDKGRHHEGDCPRHGHWTGCSDGAHSSCPQCKREHDAEAEARAREAAEQEAVMQARFQALRDHIAPYAIALVEKELGVALSPQAWNAVIDPDPENDRGGYLEIKLDGVRIVVQQTYEGLSHAAVQQLQGDPALMGPVKDQDTKGDANSFKFRGLVWNSAKQKMERFTRAAFGEALRAIRPGMEIPDEYEPEVINDAKVIHFDRPEGLKAAAADTTSEDLGITTTEDEWVFCAGDETSDRLRYVEHQIIPGRLWLRVTGFLGDDGEPKVSPQIWCPAVLGENNWLPMSQAMLNSVRSMLTAGPGGGPLRIRP